MIVDPASIVMSDQPIRLTEQRVREVFREYDRLVPGFFGGVWMLLRSGISLLVKSPEKRMADVVEVLSSSRLQRLHALGTEKHRAEAIAKIIAYMGVDDARLHATDLSIRAAREGKQLTTQAWKYSVWEYKLLRTALVIGGDTSPIQPDEVDAVHRALAEMRRRDWYFRMAYRSAVQAGEKLRADPASKTTPAGARTRSAEARRWLSRRRESLLAANRFATTEEALAFVESLYAAGAMAVRVPGDTIESDDDFDHSDTLEVTLPKEPEARRRVFEIANKEAGGEGFDDVADTGQKKLTLWWD